jgi:hypothetical protein
MTTFRVWCLQTFGECLEEKGELTGVGLPPAGHTTDILHTLLHSPEGTPKSKEDKTSQRNILTTSAAAVPEGRRHGHFPEM